LIRWGREQSRNDFFYIAGRDVEIFENEHTSPIDLVGSFDTDRLCRDASIENLAQTDTAQFETGRERTRGETRADEKRRKNSFGRSNVCDEN
tara:strand:- start:209 stop:484 length:276 start_codon:yes stop_codon:yes gene_type:complete